MFRSPFCTSMLTNSLVAGACGLLALCSQTRAEFVSTPGGVGAATGQSSSPFSNRGDTNGNRFQQVYSSRFFDAVGPVQSISAVAFHPRQSTFLTLIGDSVTFSEISFRLSTTSREGNISFPNGISSNLDLNVGADVATVFSGPLTLSGQPGDFDYLVNFTTAFRYLPSAGNLLLEVIIPDGATVTSNGSIGFTQLASFIELPLGDDGVASAIDSDLRNNSSIGSNSSSGVVTRFTTTPVATAPVPEPTSVTIWSALIALATTLRVRSRNEHPLGQPLQL